MKKYRKNPPDRVSGLPHKSKKLLETSKAFEQSFDVVRSKLGTNKEILKEEAISEAATARTREKAQTTEEELARLSNIAQFLEPVDFSLYIESLASFQLDLEGFLAGLQEKIGESDDPKITNIYNQYLNVFKRCRALVLALKSLK